MSEENANSLVAIDRKSIVLSTPGSLLTRMTSDLLPLALKKMDDDESSAIPHYLRGVESYNQKNYENALSEFILAAELGHKIAQYLLADMYLNGFGTQKDYESAFYWFHRAADQGDANALNKLGWMCEAGLGVDRDQSRAVNWFRQAAERGHLEAQFNLGAKYDNGEGVIQNHAEAVRWYRLSAEQGFADARFFLAQALETGEGLPINFDEALDWYILSSEQGHKSAKLKLWGHALAGGFVPEDEAEKIFIESIGVEMQDSLAEFRTAYRMLVGDGRDTNPVESLKLYESSARKGFGPAAWHLTLIYTHGVGVLKDPSSASVWKTKSLHLDPPVLAPDWMYLENGSDDIDLTTEYRIQRIKSEAGVKSAFSLLAEMYYFGNGTAINYDEALRWARVGAGVDNAWCHYLCGYMHLHGVATQPDKSVAIKHLQRAAKLGNTSASKLYAETVLATSNDKRKIATAIKFLLSLAEGGDQSAQFRLGYLYSTGEKVEQSHDLSIHWYEKSAAQGNSAALFNLGWKNEHGNGVDKNVELALQYYKKSAEAGFVRACEVLQGFYSDGVYVAQNAEEAKKWSDLAVKLKREAEASQQDGKKINLSYKGSSRRDRLAEKRALQKRASDLLSESNR